MKSDCFKKLKNQKGSATVEATVSFTAFIFLIFTILNLVNYCRAQMLISNAVDTAVKEISQYSYFYEISGLNKFSKDLAEVSSVGSDQVNGVIETVDGLYKSISKAGSDAQEQSTNFKNAITEGTIDSETLNQTLNTLEVNKENISKSIEDVSQSFNAVLDNPMMYIKSILAIAGNAALDELKTYVIAAPLAKAFTIKHFGSDKEAADKTLERLGVVEGVEGLNFNMSSIFSSTAPDEIHIVVYYKLKLLQVFKELELEVLLCKEAYATAWLGGDSVIVKVEPPKKTEKTEDKKTEEDSPENKNDSESETETEDNPGVNPESEENDKPQTKSTGYWTYQHDPTGYDGSDRVEAFYEDFKEEYNIDFGGGNYYFEADKDETCAYCFRVVDKWNYDPYTTMGGKVENPGVNILSYGMKLSIEDIAQGNVSNGFGGVQEFNGIAYVVYVPENMPDDQYQKLLRDLETCKKNMQEYANSLDGIPDGFDVNFEIKRAGGTYDYGE